MTYDPTQVISKTEDHVFRSVHALSVYHRNFPEVRGEGSTPEDAAHAWPRCCHGPWTMYRATGGESSSSVPLRMSERSPSQTAWKREVPNEEVVDTVGHSRQLARTGSGPARRGILDGVAFCGDVVGVGPQPVECVRWVAEHAEFRVRGDLDNTLAFGLDGDGAGSFREASPITRAWLRRLLAPVDLAFLRSLPTIDWFEWMAAISGFLTPRPKGTCSSTGPV